jgi:hypothetical protein
MRGLSWCNKYNIIKNVRDHQGKKNQRGIEFCDDNHAGEARGGGGTAVSGASCGRGGAEVSGGGGGDGGEVGCGNDLGGGLGEGAVQGLRPGRRIVGLGVFEVLLVMAAFSLRLLSNGVLIGRH